MKNSTWVYALPVNRAIVFWDEDEEKYVTRNISVEYAQGLVNNTNLALSDWASDTPDGLSRYYPPVLKEHKSDGWRGGDILEAKLAGEGSDKHGVYLLVDWLDGVWSQIEKDETQHISIGTVSDYVDSKGRHYPSLIKELSITEDPRLKDIGKIKDTMSLRLADVIPKQVEVKMDEDQVAMFDALLKRVESLEALVAEMKAEKAALEEQIAETELSDVEVVVEDKDKAVEALADDIMKEAMELAEKKLKSMRLGDAPAGKAPKGGTVDKLAEAKAKGLTGKDAILASLK